MKRRIHWLLCKLGFHYVVKTVVGLECAYCGKFWDKAEVLADRTI
jgi:hypothetical protein